MLEAFASGDEAGCDEIHKELCGYIYEEAYVIHTPGQVGSYLWQPWVKNYHGETAVGILNNYGWSKWVWIDQDLKASK